MPRSRTVTTLAITTGALFAANLVTLTVHDLPDQGQGHAKPADDRGAPRQEAGEGAAPQPVATALSGLLGVPSAALSPAPADTTTVSGSPIVVFSPSATPVTLTPPVAVPSALPTGQGVLVPAAAAIPPQAGAPTEAVSPPLPPSQANDAAPPGVLSLPSVALPQNLPVIEDLPATLHLIGIDLSIPLISGSWTSPLNVSPASTATTALVSVPLALG